MTLQKLKSVCLGTYIVLGLCVNSVYAQARTLTIGWSGPLSGNSAVLGVDSARAVKMVFDKANSDPSNSIHFNIVTEDDAYSTPQAVSSFRKLTSVNKISTMFFVTYGGLFAVAPSAEKEQVLLIDPLDCNEDVAKLPSYTICIAAMTEGIGRLNAETALKKGQRRAGVLYFQDDPFMATVLSSTENTLNAHGGKVLLKEGHSGSNADFRTSLSKAKKLGIDSLYLYGYDELALAMKQARQLGMDVQFYATATVMSPGFIKAAGSSLDGTIYSVFTPSNEEFYKSFISQFTQTYGAPPILDIATVPSFDAANIIVNFAKSYKGDLASKKFSTDLKDYFYQLRDYDGVSGTITISSDGATRSLTLASYEVHNGQRKMLNR